MGLASPGFAVTDGERGGKPLRRPAGEPDHADPIARVNQAVRAVLAGMHAPAPSRSGKEPESCTFAGTLLSVRHASALPPGIREVRAAPGTVVTPLAGDLLRRLGVSVRWISAAEARTARRGEWGFAVLDVWSPGAMLALRKSLLEGPDAWFELDSSLDRVTGWLLDGAERGALVLTPEPAVTVWRACREPGVRAAAAAEPTDAHRAVRDLGANLLAVEPAGKPLALMRQLAAAFRRGGAPRIPEPLLAEAQP